VHAFNLSHDVFPPLTSTSRDATPSTTLKSSLQPASPCPFRNMQIHGRHALPCPTSNKVDLDSTPLPWPKASRSFRTALTGRTFIFSANLVLTALWRYTIRGSSEICKFEKSRICRIGSIRVRLTAKTLALTADFGYSIKSVVLGGGQHGIPVFTKLLGSDWTHQRAATGQASGTIAIYSVWPGTRHEEIDETRGTAARQTRRTPSSSSSLSSLYMIRRQLQRNKGSSCSTGT
jgi:hypothetical protein